LLELLAGCPDGVTAAGLEQNGIAANVLRRVVARNFARVTAKRIAHIPLTVARFHVTAAGKAALKWIRPTARFDQYQESELISCNKD
jgi:hypothetical protein